MTQIILGERTREMKYQVTLEIEESSEMMAYQLLAIAIKKKFKDQIRPVDIDKWKERHPHERKGVAL